MTSKWSLCCADWNLTNLSFLSFPYLAPNCLTTHPAWTAVTARQWASPHRKATTSSTLTVTFQHWRRTFNTQAVRRTSPTISFLLSTINIPPPTRPLTIIIILHIIIIIMHTMYKTARLTVPPLKNGPLSTWMAPVGFHINILALEPETVPCRPWTRLVSISRLPKRRIERIKANLRTDPDEWMLKNFVYSISLSLPTNALFPVLSLSFPPPLPLSLPLL